MCKPHIPAPPAHNLRPCDIFRARIRTKIELVILKIFTIGKGCDIIFSVKRLTTFLICAVAAAATLACTAAVGPQTEYFADAASGDTVYPDFVSKLDVGGFDNYAVGEDSFALSQGSRLYIYQGGTSGRDTDEDGNAVYVYEDGIMINDGENLYAYDHSSDIVGMSYSAENGGYLLRDELGGVYLYSDGEVTDSNETVELNEDRVFYGDILMYLTDGTLTCVDISSTDPQTYVPEGSFSELKVTDGGVYAIKDGELCIITGNSASALSVTTYSFSYIDLNQESTISVGNTAQLLKSDTTARYRVVVEGQYVTEIDLSDISGQYFVTAEHDDGTPATYAMDQTCYALLLCTTGNADIIAIGNTTYITYALSAASDLTSSAPPFENALLNYPAGIYSRPYMSEATQLLSLDAGATVSVESQITAEGQPQAGDALPTDFCLVTYTADDGTATTGYIATAFLTVYDFSGEDGEFTDPTPPEDYSEENVILTVVLVIVIVVLVIIGVAYLAYVSGANRRKNKENKNPDSDIDDDNPPV